MQVGSIDEVGFIKNLSKKGFTLNQCLSEIIANSIDANASNIVFYKKGEKIYIIDDGNGMDRNDIKNMFSNKEDFTDIYTNSL